MKAVILAAGTANRLKPLTAETPKGLLKIADRSIFEYTIENLIKNDINDILVVTGFYKEKVESFFKERKDINVSFVNNPDYSTTNNAYSLFLAKEYIQDDFILLDSDIVFHPDIIKKLLLNKDRPVLAVNRHKCGVEEIKVIVDDNHKVLNINKEVEPSSAWGESIGIEVFSKKDKDVLFDILNSRIKDYEGKNEFYEKSFEEMIKRGHYFYAVDTTEFPSIEIDYKEDLKNAEMVVAKIFS
ncbi:MAG TPA: phosphocholine cytidylyltransferase family protein [bacterium]|nr:phosphocholine cytidylyltransferase family protein [bacterium]